MTAWVGLATAGAWFRSLPADLQRFLQRAAEPRALAAGERLFARGDACDGIYFVEKGAIRVTGLNSTGQEALLAMLYAPNWFGEISLFDREPRTHDAWAETDATLRHVPDERLRSHLAQHPDDWQHIGRLLTQKIRATFTGLEGMVLLLPTGRIAQRLADMAGGHGAWSAQTQRTVRVSQEQLGLMLGLSRQTVNQSLRDLEHAGAIRRMRGAVEVLDLGKLQRCR